jgi:MFS family permease
MTDGARRVRRTYLLLTLLSTLAASFIWGVNTLFLLDAGLSNTEAFSANAFFTAGQVVFEVPTGVVADTWGRRASYLLGAATLLGSTLLYLLMWRIEAPFLGWAVASIVLGLGFTFFSGATEAWLVDALAHHSFAGELEGVFARGQMVAGGAMLTGSVAGGFVAQAASLGAPYLVRAGLLLLTLVVAFFMMRDEGFEPRHGSRPGAEMVRIARASIDVGWRNRSLRWVMLASPFTMGVSFYAFYATQPYLLELYGDRTAFGLAGVAAAILAGAQIVGGLIAPAVRRWFERRTSVLLLAVVVGSIALFGVGLVENVWLVIGLIVAWALAFSVATPVRQAYVNEGLPSEQRATVLSFDSLLGSSGGVVAQPALGRAADAFGYGPSYVISSAVYLAAAPFLLLARREGATADRVAGPDPTG